MSAWACCTCRACSLAGAHVTPEPPAAQALGTFGMGIHSCLGAPLYMQEAKALLALIARGYDVHNVSGPVDWGAQSAPRRGPPRFQPHSVCCCQFRVLIWRAKRTRACRAARTVLRKNNE